MNGIPGRNRWRGVAAMLVAGLAGAMLLAGCGEENASGGSSSLIAPQAAAAEAAGGVNVPTLDELTTLLELTEDQVTAIRPLLAAWNEAMERGRQRFVDRGGLRPGGDEGGSRFGGDRPGPGGRFGGDGPGNGERPGPGGGGPEGGQNPVMQFVEGCSSILDTGQFVLLCDYLVEQRDQAQAERMERGDRDRRGGPMGFLARELGLDESAAQTLGEAFRTAMESVQAAHRAVAEGSLSAEGFRDAVAAAVSGLAGEAETLLDEDTYDELVALLAQGRTRLAERALERDDEGVERQVDRLTAMLGLDDATAAAVESALQDGAAQRHALLAQIRDGGVTYADALYGMHGIAGATQDAVKSALTQDQGVRLDALHRLAHAPRPLPIWF